MFAQTGQRYVAHYDKASRIRIEVEIGKLLLKRYVNRKEKGSTVSWSAESADVISMSLHGDNIDTLYGTLRYSQLIPILFPKWRLRVYVADSDAGEPRVLKILLKKLEFSGVEIIRLGNKTTSRLDPSLWRYLIADDMTVKRFIVRDGNTRPSEREAAALDDWSLYDAPFFCIRDHPVHARQSLVPGLVGGMPSSLRNITGFDYIALFNIILLLVIF